MKRSLGISLYPEHSTIEQDIQYINLAHKYGFTRIFTCLLSVNKPKSEIIHNFKAIITHARKLGFEVILDIAPNVFTELGISYDDLSFFQELQATGIRLDLGFDGAKEAMMTFNPQELAIEINMSNDVAYVDNIMTYQPNAPFLYGCHNFYPQKGTGLPYDFFIKCSERFKKFGLRTAAFINSQTATIGPWDINDGLCTLEIHRDLPITVQAKHLFATNLIDDVIIGNAYASEEELAKLAAINLYQLELIVDTLPNITEDELTILFNTQHYRRGDITTGVVRSTEIRKKYITKSLPLHDNTQDFVTGDVLIGNNSFGKYKGELQIALQTLADTRKNKVAKVISEEMILLDFIKPWTKFKFQPRK
jgi:Uncharacterized conserved protein